MYLKAVGCGLWNTRKMHASKWNAMWMFERWIRCVATHLILHFQLHRWRLLCVHVFFSQTNNWPQLLTDRYMPFVTQTAVEIYIQRIRCLVYFPFVRLLFVSISLSLSPFLSHRHTCSMFSMQRLFQKDMAKIPCRCTTFITTKSHRMSNSSQSYFSSCFLSVHKWPNETELLRQISDICIHS